MPVFKLCLKIFKKNLKVMLIYFGVFIMVSVIMMSNNNPREQAGFELSKVKVAVFSEDFTPLTEGLLLALEDIVSFVPLTDDREVIQDALYYRNVQYVLRIPEGFSNALATDKPLVLEKTSLPETFQSTYIDVRIDQYLNLTRLYLRQMPYADFDRIKGYVLEDLRFETQVTMLDSERKMGEGGMMQYYFNYLAYTFMFVIIMGVSTIMLVFNDLKIKRRNACAPISPLKVTFEFFIAILLFTIISWLILVALSLFFSKDELGDAPTMYFILNSLVFALSGAGISFLIGNLVKGREAISAIANTVTLGSCFISGVFVPQAILSESVLRMASFLPTYWYVKGNSQIASQNALDLTQLGGLTNSILIQIGFAFAFFIIAMVVGKHKRLKVEEA